MMSKFSARGISLSLRCSRKGLQLTSAQRTAVSAISVRAASTSLLSPLFGVSTHYINRLKQVHNGNKQLIRLYAGGLPEHRLITMPSLSPTMEHGTLVKWQKKEGDEVAEGDVVCEIETDKSVMAFESAEDGILAKILVPEGTKGIKIGKPICVFVDKKEDCGAFANFKAEGKHYEAPSAPPEAAVSGAAAASAGSYPDHVELGFPALSPTMDTGKVVSWHKQVGDEIADGDLLCEIETDKSVMAFETTEEGFLAKIILPEGTAGVPVGKQIQGTGPGGRIIAADVEGAQPSEVAADFAGEELEEPIAGPKKPKKKAPKRAVPGDPKYKDIPLSNMRETIAKRLLQSKQDVPHYYLTSEVKVDELLKLRKKLNEDLKDQGIKVSINDFIIKASALACLDVPEANSYFMEKEKVIRQNLTVDVSVAVKTKTGLITPIVYNADTKGLAEISAEIKQLAEKAHKNKLKPQEYMGGTFTVSNLGMFGSIHHFTAIINPPQACILAVGGSDHKVVPDGDHGYKTITTLFVTMSCDHRVVDGGVGAIWLKHFKEYMEKPETMLLPVKKK